MLSTTILEKKLQYLKPEFRDIILELRELIRSIAPDATEELKRSGISYYFGDRGGPVSAGICQIEFKSDHIRLAFIHGAFLPDPHQLLCGDRIAKRFLKITSFDSTPWEKLRDLIDVSSRYDPYSMQIKKKNSQS
jgi:hypothetical protein